MNVCMSGLDYEKAKIALREQLSFTKTGVLDIVSIIVQKDDVLGAVLLSTCNRTEIYLSCADGTEIDPGRCLCEAAGVEYQSFAGAFVTRRGETCIRHLMAVACGLKSQILGEDQILTQVKTAAVLAREGHAADATLETLFRTASSCGKAVKTSLRLTGQDSSAAQSAVSALERHFGSLAGKSAVVIGNGEMGRLSAGLLRERDCGVTVTLRSYHHGIAVVPAGCNVVPYDERYAAMENADMLISATTSPHYTVSAEAFARLAAKPEVLVDLAIPRDIEPEVGEIVTLYNIDSFDRSVGADPETLRQVEAIAEEYMARFYRWSNYRECMPAIEELKEAVLERVKTHLDLSADPEETAESAAVCAVDLLTGGLSGCLSPEKLRLCAEGIRARTR
ncbi:MAG: glutamyl-tRNA reductase [Oscillospiraceae bacterium]